MSITSLIGESGVTRFADDGGFNTGPLIFELPDGRIIKITALMLQPVAARKLLELNTRNRRLNPAVVEQIKSDICSNGWYFTGETIKIATDSDGVTFLADAQHRLAGIANSDRAVPVIIVENLDPEATRAIDQNKPRQVSHILQMTYGHTDIKNDSTVTAIAGLHLDVVGLLPRGRATKQQIAEYAHKNLDRFSYWASWAKSVAGESQKVQFDHRTASAMTPAPVGVLAMHMFESGADRELVQDFFRRIATGAVADSDTTNVITAIRKRQINGVTLSRLVGGGSSSGHVLSECAVYILAYNRWVLGERVGVIKGNKQDFRTLSELPPVLKGRGVL